MKNKQKILFLLGVVPLFSFITIANADLPFSYGKASANYVDNSSDGVNAGSNPYYLGGTIGSSDASSYCEGETGCEDTDTAWKVFGGYKVLENVSAEVGYVNLGDIHKNGENSDVSAFTVNAVGSVKVTERFDIFGKIGGMRWASDNTDGDKDGFGATYGIGAKMNLSESTRIRAEWEQFPGIETNNTEDTDINMLSVGIELSTY